MDNYTRAWIRIIKIAHFFRFLPWGAYVQVGRFIGKYFSFLELHKENLMYNLEHRLELKKAEAKKVYDLNLESAGVAMCMIEKLHNISTQWLEKNICVDGEESLKKLIDHGGIIFSHHSFHHNLLMSYFKLFNVKCYPVVNLPSAFSGDDFLYNWTVKLNAATESNLCGGAMLYVDDKRKLFEEMQRVLDEGSVLIVLCDFNSDAKNSMPLKLFTKELNIPTGALKYAQSKECEVCFAGFRWQAKRDYTLTLQKMDKEDGYVESYMQNLEKYLRDYPYAWQNWEHL